MMTEREIVSIKNYKIIDEIARTKESILLKAVKADGSDKLVYAIKVFKNKSMLDTLTNEMKVSQEIENNADRSIVRSIYEIGEEDAFVYAVMQFKHQGLFLSEAMNALNAKYGDGNIPFEIQLSIVKQILISLDKLHNCYNGAEDYVGYVHLDLHPGNIFLENFNIEKDEIGTVKFIDLQSAMPLDASGVSKRSGAITVTSGYSAPEVTDADKDEITAAADIYSVAAIAYKLNTGKNYENYGEFVVATSNPICDYIYKLFLSCGLNASARNRYESAVAMLETLDRIADCEKAYASDYYKLFVKAYELCVPKEYITEHCKGFVENNMKSAIAALEDSLNKTHIKVNLANYVFDVIWGIYVCNMNVTSGKLYNTLVRSGIACRNHIGKSKDAISLFERVDKNNIRVMDYLDLMNRAVVSYDKELLYEESAALIKKNIEIYENIKETYKSACGTLELGEECARTPELGKAYGAYAMHCGQLGMDKETVVSYFEKALNEFAGIKANMKITWCRIMFYAASINDKELFEKYMREYFGAFDEVDSAYLAAAIKQCLAEGIIHDRFGLVMLLKGINCFYADKLDESVLELIAEFIQNRMKNEHPYQLIYMHSAKLMYSYYEQTSNEEFMEDSKFLYDKAINCLSNGNLRHETYFDITRLMAYNAAVDYYKKFGKEAELEKLLSEIHKKAVSFHFDKLEKAIDEGADFSTLLTYEQK